MTDRWTQVSTLEDIEWPEHAVLVCDETVRWAAPTALANRSLAVEGGEGIKTLARIEELAEAVLGLRSSRPLTIVAMGGGSVGDAVGFLASVLWRGVELWHVPTTLLAAVDSAHGGKTALNLGEAKNQIGTFWPAERTIIADALLETMPLSLRLEGLTELVKALWLGDSAAVLRADELGIDELASAPWSEVGPSLTGLLADAIRVKLDIVARDPREQLGIRTWLNLGHTAAHALELICGAPHGVAVAWGMACAAHISHARKLLATSERDMMFRQLYPLLGNLPLAPDRTGFDEAFRRDKKTVDGRVRAILLQGAGQPIVVDDVSANDWFDALAAVRGRLFHADATVELRGPRPAILQMPASKSELNRALVICALRGDERQFSFQSDADDVRAMRAGIASLRRGEVADAENGGTTFRFLSTIAVTRPHGGAIRVGAQLATRPQQALLDAWRSVGVAVERVGDTFQFGTLPDGPLTARVDGSESSQFASALALLGAAGREVELVFDELVSPGYFQMTQSMLEMEELDVTSDASCAAMWHTFNALGGAVRFASTPSSMQPDARIVELLWPADETDDLSLDIGESPDLACVLAAYGALSAPEVSLRGAAHLRHKESNRIEELVAAFSEVGIEVHALEDGIRVPRGRQVPIARSVFNPRGDHRLAFAAVVLSSAAPLVLRNPRCVTKSYANVYADARAAGFSVGVVGF